MFDDDLLQSYMDTFYGYGNYQGRYWFIGMEEGGGGSYEAVDKRLSAWDHRGRKELDDLVQYSYSLQGVMSHFFTDQPKSQATWNKLIRILLSINGDTPTLQEVKDYQRTRWGRFGEDTCVIELLPLPSPSKKKWLYCDYSLLPQLRTRREYEHHNAEGRARHIKSKIEAHKPAIVVFYSIDKWHRQWWKLMADVEFAKVAIGEDKAYLGSNGHTVFAIVKHPVARGISKDYSHGVGKLIGTWFSRESD